MRNKVPPPNTRLPPGLIGLPDMGPPPPPYGLFYSPPDKMPPPPTTTTLWGPHDLLPKLGFPREAYGYLGSAAALPLCEKLDSDFRLMDRFQRMFHMLSPLRTTFPVHPTIRGDTGGGEIPGVDQLAGRAFAVPRWPFGPIPALPPGARPSPVKATHHQETAAPTRNYAGPDQTSEMSSIGNRYSFIDREPTSLDMSSAFQNIGVERKRMCLN